MTSGKDMETTGRAESERHGLLVCTCCLAGCAPERPGVCWGSSSGPQRAQTRGWMQDGSLEAPSGRCCRSSGRGMQPGVPKAGLAGVPVALPWHGRSCQLSLCLPAVGRKKLPAWTTGWDVLGCPWNAGQPSGHLVRGHPASGKERPLFAGLGQRTIFTRKEPRPGRPGAYAHPTSQRHHLALGCPLCKAGEHQCHCPVQELVPRTTQSPSKE